MKKYLLCVLLLFLCAASFCNAEAAKSCGVFIDGTFTWDDTNKKLTLDNGCTSVVEHAFGYRDFEFFKDVLSIDLANTSVTSIGYEAFSNDLSLTSVTFPNSLSFIDSNAFAVCTALSSVDLSNTSITTLGTSMDLPVPSGGQFIKNSSLVSVKLPASLTSLGDNVFSQCTSLTSIDFPASLTSIIDGTFYGCSALPSVDLSKTSITLLGYGVFYQCTSLASVQIPTTLTEIGELAFYGCTSLATLDLSKTAVTTIGENAFANLKNPSTITVSYGSKAHQLLGGTKGINAKTGDPIGSKYGNNYTTLIVLGAPKDTPTPTPDPRKPTATTDPLEPTLLPTATPQPPFGGAGAVEEIRVVPLPEDEFGSYELDPVTGEKTYLLFHTYDICMNFLADDALCSGYEHCYHK